jgi:hypothetical protein
LRWTWVDKMSIRAKTMLTISIPITIQQWPKSNLQKNYLKNLDYLNVMMKISITILMVFFLCFGMGFWMLLNYNWGGLGPNPYGQPNFNCIFLSHKIEFVIVKNGNQNSTIRFGQLIFFSWLDYCFIILLLRWSWSHLDLLESIWTTELNNEFVF